MNEIIILMKQRQSDLLKQIETKLQEFLKDNYVSADTKCELQQMFTAVNIIDEVLNKAIGIETSEA